MLRLTALAAVLLAACAAPGGAGAPEEYVLAFQVTDDRQAFVERTEPLAEWITQRTGVPTRVLTVQDDRAQITALATGQAHAGYMSGGPAWIGWQNFDLDAIAAEVREDGRTSYVAGLWVLSDSGVGSVEDMRGKRSCHTGELTGTGMFVPMGYLVREGLVETDDLDMDDIGALAKLRERFFSASMMGGGYVGAFRCLSVGEGDVATGRDTAWDDFCATDPEPWCLPRDGYRYLPDGGLARVPSHPVMVSPHLPTEDRIRLRDALLALNADAGGREILAEVLGVPALAATTAAQHLGPYGEVIEHVPGIRAHFLGSEG